LLYPKGKKDWIQTHIGRIFRLDSSKAQSTLGIKFRPVEDSIVDTVTDLIARKLLADIK